MKKMLFRKNQYGNVSIILLIILAGVLLLWQINKPTILSPNHQFSNQYSCRAETENRQITITYTKIDETTPTTANYRKISTGRLIDPYFIYNWQGGKRDSTTHLKYAQDAVIEGKQVKLYDYCYGHNGENDNGYGTSQCAGDGTQTRTTVVDKDGNEYQAEIDLRNYPGLLYINTSNNHFSDPKYWTFDIYLNTSTLIPDVGLRCVDKQLAISGTPPMPTIEESSDSPDGEKSLQLRSLTVTYPRIVYDNDWLSPHCKPLIYLYPEKTQQVHVKLNPKGFLTETIPPYPKEGWVVIAHSDGTLTYKEKTYDYLYYESKIRDEETKVPTHGYVKKYGELKALYEELLPRFGLNEKETREFVDYWTEVLPKAPYYFVGIMDKESIDYIEPLTITPKPDTIIRVRTYFKALEQPVVVVTPTLGKTPKREGFTVVEWGGMVKTDLNHPFTCSQ